MAMSTRRIASSAHAGRSPRPRPAGSPSRPVRPAPGPGACGRRAQAATGHSAQLGSAKRNGSPARQASSAACGAPRRRTRSSTPSGGRPPSAVSEAGTSTPLSGSTHVGRGRALAEQDDVLRPGQGRARHDRARRARRPQPVGEPVAGAQVVGHEVAGPQPVLGRLGEADPRQARPGRRAAPTSGGARARAARRVRRSGRAQELRPRPERVQAEVLRRRLLGHAVEAAGDPAGLGPQRAPPGRQPEGGDQPALTRTRCSGSSPPRAAGRAAARDRRAARAASRRPAPAAASRTTRRRPRA